MFTKDDLVFSYSRKQAIDDGVLVDLTEQAKAYGFKVPFAATDTVWHAIQWREGDKPGAGQCTEGRLHDVLTLAIRAAAGAQSDRVEFQVLMVPHEGDSIAAKVQHFALTIGPGDGGEPVCTLMLPEED